MRCFGESHRLTMVQTDLLSLVRVDPERARALLEAAKGTQAERAVALGVSVATLQRVERRMRGR